MSDITQRMINGEADANDHITAKPFYQANSPGADGGSALDRVTNPASPLPAQSGSQLHDELMRRAQQKAFLDSNLGAQSQFRDYKTSAVGGIGQDAETRRKLSEQRKSERKRREERFGKRDDEDTNNKSLRNNKRQRYNTRRSLDDEPQGSSTPRSRQGQNSQPNHASRPRTSFQEPQSRGYNPYG